MVRAGLRAVLLCALLALAGCGSFASGPESPTLSPAPVPDETPEPSYPPGTGPGGVVDPLALAEGHHTVLHDQSYTVRRTRTVRYPNGTLYERTVLDGRFSADRSRFHLAFAAEGPGGSVFGTTPARLELWSNGDVLARSLTVRNETRRDRLPPETFSQRPGPFDDRPGAALGLRSAVREAYLLFRAVEVDLRPAENGADYRARGDEFAHPVALVELDRVQEPRDVDLDATLTAEGFVRRYRIAYDARIDGRAVEVERTVRFSAVGTTTIERPAWVEPALNGTDE